MPVTSWKCWPILAVAGGALLTVTACAPNHVVEPRLNPSMQGAEREESHYGTLLRLASSTRASGDPSAAVNIYQQAISLEPDRVDAYVLMGDTLVELKSFDDAAKTYDQALKREPNNVAAHRGYARTMLGLHRPEAAIVHYQAVLQQDPNDVQAHNGLGVAYDLAGQFEPAEAAYRAGLALAPDSMLLRNNLGLSLSLAGRHKEAIELLRTLADEPGAQARNRQNLALAYGLSGDLVAAERVSRLDLDEEAVQNNLAYFAALAAVDDQRKRGAALGVNAPELTDHAGDARERAPAERDRARRPGPGARAGADRPLVPQSRRLRQRPAGGVRLAPAALAVQRPARPAEPACRRPGWPPAAPGRPAYGCEPGGIAVRHPPGPQPDLPGARSLA